MAEHRTPAWGRLPADGHLLHGTDPAAEKTLSILRAHAAGNDAAGELSAQTVEALASSHVSRLLTPRQYGGHQADLRALTDVTAQLARADGSAAWVGMIFAVTNWLACLFPQEAVEEVFGADPDARVSGVAAPTGTALPAEGGWRLSGRWSYASGGPHATWAVLGTMLTGPDGHIADQALVLVPASQLGLERTWDGAGMRATRSDTFHAEDVFVPAHRVLSVPAASQGMHPAAAFPGEALYRSAFGPMLILCLAGPLLGLGRAGLELVIEQAGVKPLAFTRYARQADAVVVQAQIAQAALQLEAAEFLIHRAAAEVDEGARVDRPLTPAARARIRAQAGYAAQQVLQALQTLLDTHGSGSFSASSDLQRIWRDANTAARHAGLVPAVGYEVFGKSLLGNEETISLMV
ncbi:acyl-CoA dehydrogenase family protein (plasmid) [Streptomyces sp. NBC_01558]|uniref:acyl-CoA dehydrogenase family protein n=1 Tax=Streptomyces sp. NBC_01558 TaxID=2975878 RepID=UPI002DD7EA46|nr:acyl-CoA dehydrogenase family protein [Streptomyces sp. NBC_01558]WSD82821.1 acyl-CoA dehydrogenase family protein [Streptomyces sp. NBC_01558]